MVLIVDGHVTHKARNVTRWVDSADGRLALVRLSTHSPFLNPDESVPEFVKTDCAGKHAITGPDQFQCSAIIDLQRFQSSSVVFSLTRIWFRSAPPNDQA